MRIYLLKKTIFFYVEEDELKINKVTGFNFIIPITLFTLILTFLFFSFFYFIALRSPLFFYVLNTIVLKVITTGNVIIINKNVQVT